MPGLISAGTTAQLRRTFDSLLAHTYTRTPVTAGADDTYDLPDVPGSAVTGQPCRYRPESRLRLDDGNRVTVSVPTLTVPHDDPIAVGDLVSNVQDADGVVLLVGPVKVEDVVPSAGLGPTLQLRAVLRGGDIR